jgi:hypothetical protein
MLDTHSVNRHDKATMLCPEQLETHVFLAENGTIGIKQFEFVVGQGLEEVVISINPSLAQALCDRILEVAKQTSSSE